MILNTLFCVMYRITHFLGQTTGQTFFATKYCLYIAQVYRLKAITNVNRKDKQLQNALSYPNILFYIIIFIIGSESLFLIMYWYLRIFYCPECTPLGIAFSPWFVPFMIGNDAFWFVFLTALFVVKIAQIQKSGYDKKEIKGFERKLWAILFLGIISNISGIVFMTCANKWLVYAGEFAMSDTFVK